MKIGDRVKNLITGFEGVIVDFTVRRGHPHYLVLPFKNGQWQSFIDLETIEKHEVKVRRKIEYEARRRSETAQRAKDLEAELRTPGMRHYLTS